MAKAFVSAGSNIEPEKNVREALRLLSLKVIVTNISTVYLTEPIGRPEQPHYYNCVFGIETDLSPISLKLDVLRRIEEQLGRTRSSDKFAPRTIDLDLILYDDLVATEPELTLPDPDILQRPFLIAGLYELQADLVLPGNATRIASAEEMRTHSLTPLSAYTRRLREELHYGP